MTPATVLVLGHRFSNLDIERDVLAGAADVVDGNSLTGDELPQALGLAEAILLGTRGRVDAAILDTAPNLRAVVRYGIGTDNIAVDEATRRGIAVANVPDYCVDEVADHAVTLLLAASRHLIAAYRAARSGVWGTAIMRGTERLSAQTVGIVGFGRIGQTVARKVMPFMARVLAFDPVVPVEVMTAQGVEPADLSTLLHSSDYISLHCPLVPETRHLFDARVLAQMKPHAWLINTSRGELIEESALIDALASRALGGAALDVRTTEPPVADDPLLALDNVLLTPHVAWYSESAVVDLRRKAAEQVGVLLQGGNPEWLINPVVTASYGEQSS